MAVIAAFKDGWTALLENPVLLAAGLIYAVGSQLGTIGELVDSVVVSALASIGWFLLVPFVLGGLIGLAVDALRETDPSVAQFFGAGRTYYVRILLATVLFVVLVIGVMIVTMIPSFIVGVGLLGIASLESGAALGIGVVLVLGYVLLLAVFMMYLQFYDAAIVVEDEPVVAALTRSVGLVRRNLVSVIGYSILWSILLNAFMVPEYLAQLSQNGVWPLESLALEPTTVQLLTVPVSVLLGTVAFAYLYTVHTAYYVRLVATDSDGELPTPAD